MKKLNVLWITCDELKPSSVSCYGNPFVRLPAIERLAREGTLFERAFVPMPKCVPCRGLMMTGRYAHVDGLRTMSTGAFEGENFMRLGLKDTSLLHLLKGAGYRTSLQGKNHLLRDEAMTLLDDPPRRDGVEKVRYSEPASEQMRRAYFGGRVADDYDPQTFPDAASARSTIEFIEAAGDEPFFALLDISEPHPPYQEWPGFLDDLPLDQVPLPPIPAIEDCPEVIQAWRRGHDVDALTTEERQRLQRAYWTQTMYADSLVGQVLDTLDRLGLTDDTLVVWGSDHGDFIGEFGCYEKWDNALYDCITQVPLIMRLPGAIPAGERQSPLVEAIDIVPTVLDLCKMDVPVWMHGQSLLPLMEGRTDRHKEVVFSQGGVEPDAVRNIGRNYEERLQPVYYGKQRALLACPDSLIRAHMVRSDRHKLIYHLSGRHELYDLEVDPHEQHNRYGDRALALEQADLEARLLKFFATYQQDRPVITELWA